MSTILKHRDGNVHIEPSGGKHRIRVDLHDKGSFVPIHTCETSYPLDLINTILMLKGIRYLCDDILREESTDYVQKNLQYDLLSYINEEEFINKRLLDFGCGSGASTMILSRMFPQTEIVGVELEKNMLSIAKARADHYGYTNVKCLLSPRADRLPSNVGTFDYVVLSAVYEHLLPNERTVLLPKIWNTLRAGGILFLNQTPSRYFPLEVHTTNMPFINYFPDRVAHLFVQNFSYKNLRNIGWEGLLRKGIRGGGIRKILDVLGACSQKPVLLNPSKLGVHDRIELWYVQCNTKKYSVIKKVFLFVAKCIKRLTGLTILPSLSLAIKKCERQVMAI